VGRYCKIALVVSSKIAEIRETTQNNPHRETSDNKKTFRWNCIIDGHHLSTALTAYIYYNDQTEMCLLIFIITQNCANSNYVKVNVVVSNYRIV
jgi:hypothetical protein